MWRSRLDVTVSPAGAVAVFVAGSGVPVGKVAPLTKPPVIDVGAYMSQGSGVVFSTYEVDIRDLVSAP